MNKPKYFICHRGTKGAYYGEYADCIEMGLLADDIRFRKRSGKWYSVSVYAIDKIFKDGVEIWNAESLNRFRWASIAEAIKED